MNLRKNGITPPRQMIRGLYFMNQHGFIAKEELPRFEDASEA